MTLDRVGRWLRRLVGPSRRSFVGVFDGGTSVSAAVDPSVGTASSGALRLQLVVWEQRL